MGNRVYVTIDNDTFYMHWNGGLDTWLPIAEVAFKYDKKKDDILNLLDACELRYELQTDKDAYNWTEENGHYYLDTTNKTFRRKNTDGTLKYFPFLYDSFKEYLIEHISENYREQVYESYWIGIQEEAEKLWNSRTI